MTGLRPHSKPGPLCERPAGWAQPVLRQAPLSALPSASLAPGALRPVGVVSVADPSLGPGMISFYPRALTHAEGHL